jgi:hypothetical protein
MIIEQKKKGNVIEYIVDKDYGDDKLEKVLTQKLMPSQIKNIINHDADVYTKEGKLLLRFRKNKLQKDNIDAFYENVIKFAENTTQNRGTASGSKSKNIYDNPKVKSNILGYFDKLTPGQKFIFKKNGMPMPKITVRETRFLTNFPEKYKKLLPLIKQIDKYYEEYIPEPYKKQRRKANQTHFKINGTAFTTITTNVNYQTAVHTDKGDDEEGFGNLAVIEHGKYKGAETCFPQYGIGVDVRTGDILYMDVHQPHGNLPLVLKSPDAKRLSIVCYLRKSIWEQTKGKTQKFKEKHNKTLKKNLLRKEKLHFE